ncbi:hypothetical protein [Confluentibacter citreus]|uniref:hypothetical protein n=1 Tax=Confluentibacter citreus TaxID=2007307 RepID=UPI000C287DFD|nr:hypothetical protein [Confluentibacter citreus]
MNIKNSNLIVLVSSTLLVVGFIISIINTMVLVSPTKHIEGSWKEISWEYEKSENINADKKISDAIKTEICKELIIHEAEVWNFSSNGNLELTSDINNEMLSWTMKGRGNILELSHNTNKIEHYNIQVLNNDQMVLYFSTDIQAKGIVKMTFERIKEDKYAQKI